MIDDGLFQFLTAAGTVTNGVLATRLYPDVLPEDNVVYPAGTLQIVSNLEERTLDDNGVPVSATARIRFEGWGKSKSQAQMVTAALRADLIVFRSALPSGDIIGNGWVANGPTTRYVEELELYLVAADWIFLYTPAAL